MSQHIAVIAKKFKTMLLPITSLDVAVLKPSALPVSLSLGQFSLYILNFDVSPLNFCAILL